VGALHCDLMSADAMNSPPRADPPVSRQSSTPDGCRVLALAGVTYQDIPRSRHGERPMGKKPLTPAQRERRRASQKRWEEKHREERRAWRDANREHR
jgi:hypothetical protein